jgi:indole-3-glycerol phosphate synthase
MSDLRTGSILDENVVRTRADLEARKTHLSMADLDQIGLQQGEPIGLGARLAEPGMSVIAEIKRASPSRGLFPVAVDPTTIAAEYVKGGAAAISVLTDAPYFRGSLDDLVAAAAVAHDAARPLPILRKDFIVDPYQIAEARALGADAVLLIVAVLDDTALATLLEEACRRGMEALVEVHDEREMARAIDAGARVIGINNRDLRTFTVDLAVTEHLAPLAPPAAVVVAESGIFDGADVERLAHAGVSAVLVGEGLITARDRAAAIRDLRSCRR